MKLVGIIVTVIVAEIIGWLINKYYKKKKSYVKVPVSLPYTRADLLYDLAFGLLAMASWGFALWIHLSVGLDLKPLLMCILLTIIGLAFLFWHFTNRHVLIPEDKEQLAEEVQCLLTKVNRQTSLFCMPLMAAFLVSMNAELFGISWDFELIALGIMILALCIRFATMTVYSKRLGFDITGSDLLDSTLS